MNGVAVYMEGGGETAEAKAQIRLGMSEFLRDLREAARRKRWFWKVVPCGSRVEARDSLSTSEASTLLCMPFSSSTRKPE